MLVGLLGVKYSNITPVNPGLPPVPFCGIWMTVQGPQEGLKGYFSCAFNC